MLQSAEDRLRDSAQSITKMIGTRGRVVFLSIHQFPVPVLQVDGHLHRMYIWYTVVRD